MSQSIKQRDLSIELLKFAAVFMVINAHMEALYPAKLSIFATGGTIGDALFMFCSGYTLFLGRMDRFDNWYKRRISRIYPSVMAWCIIAYLFFGRNMDTGMLLSGAGNWFIVCIMIYYVLLYIVRRWLMKFRWWVFVLSFVVPLVYFVLYEDMTTYHMYSNRTLRYWYWFPFMLMGAFVGNKNVVLRNCNIWDGVYSIMCIGLHLGFLLLCTKYAVLCPFQMFSLVPLMGATIFLYKFSNCDVCKGLVTSKIGGGWVTAVAGLCLESYMVQHTIFTTKFNQLFPLNLLLMFAGVLIVAYCVRSLGRLIKQIFGSESIDWKSVVSFN